MGAARIAILAVAAIAAGLAAFLVQGLVSTGSGEPAVASKGPDLSTVEVLVAASDLGIGQQIGGADVRWQLWPKAALTSSYIQKGLDPKAMEKAVGATVRQAMLAGEPLTSVKFVHSESAGFMAAMLTPGSRAVSVKISAETGAGGFILPNDRVDVIQTKESGGRNQHVSRTVITNVRVLAIDQTFREEGDKRVVVGKTATVELSQAQAELLAQAEATGVVSLALRSLADYGRKGEDQSTTMSGTVTVLRYGTPSQVIVNGATE